ncbi:MAG: hypothetical protein Q8920_10355 [Bacillota bacterium]|nr:hypothetical protein [Bacillota bacterium]
MDAKDLLVSNLSIAEENYSCKGTMVLSDGSISKNIDISSLDDAEVLDSIKRIFTLSDSIDIIHKKIMKLIIEKAALSSKISEGESYNKDTSKI